VKAERSLQHLDTRYFENHGRSTTERSQCLQKDRRHLVIYGGRYIFSAWLLLQRFRRQRTFCCRHYDARHDGQIITKTAKSLGNINCIHRMLAVASKYW